MATAHATTAIFAPMYVAVALPMPRMDPLTYFLSPDLTGGNDELLQQSVGCRVLVPLGKRIVTGTVVQTNAPFHEKARPVIEVLDVRPAFDESMLQLTRWISEYYMCSWGEVLNAALPSGLTPTSVVRVHVEARLNDADIREMAKRAPKRARLLQMLQEHSGPLTMHWIERQLSMTSASDQVDALQREGLVRVLTEVEHEARARRVAGIVLADNLVANEQEFRAALSALDERAPKQAAVLGALYLAHMQHTTPIAKARLLEELRVSASAIDGLIAKGYAVQVEIESKPAASTVSLVQNSEHNVRLTVEQQAAVDAIVRAITEKHTKPILLDGVTGSGKTIVYQHVIRHALESGKTAMVLVPEIALTPQLADRFVALFGSEVTLLHSRMHTGERADAWRAIRTGRSKIVLGPRSAVFAPIANLGVMIVDEEHEPSYKQDDPAPRYNGRDVAIMRARIEQCCIVLGSATPSIESRTNVASGRYASVQLTHRADGAQMPELIVVDMRSERKAQRVQGACSITALKAIEDRIRKNEGVLVFLNRRGYAGEVQCEDCGDVPWCQNCDVALTFHKSNRTMQCHYCGYYQHYQQACTTCGSVALKEVGSGTQRVEQDIAQWLADRGVKAVVQRMDADTTSKRGSHRKLLQRFADGEIDVVVGTQMIAKGLDLARVTLVVIVSADQSLFQSNFRASERTYQLLTQVAGRAGRTGAQPGQVLVQTSSPTHPTIVAALRADPTEWLAQEIAERKSAMYPPFARFILIEVSAPSEALAEHHAHIIAMLMPEEGDGYIRLPPVPPPIAKVRSRWRRHIVIKNSKADDPSGGRCRAILRGVLDTYYRDHATSGVRVSVDVDA